MKKMELIGPIFRYISYSSKDLDRFRTLIDFILFTRTKTEGFLNGIRYTHYAMETWGTDLTCK